MGLFDSIFNKNKDIKFNNQTLRAAVKKWLENPKKATSKYGHISSWDTSKVTDMSKLFLDAYTFNETLNHWDVSNVTNMHAMFDNAYAFNQPLDNWEVGNVTDMSEMFSSMESLAFNQPIGNWDVSNVTNMKAMFNKATFFNQPLGNWNVSSVTDMSYMFCFATAFNQPIGNWDVVNVVDMGEMFSVAKNFNQPLDNWNVSKVTDMNSMFMKAECFNQPIGDWDVSNVESMFTMFSFAESFNQPIGNWDVSNVTTMHQMFEGATSFKQDIGNWSKNEMRSVMDNILGGMHKEAKEKAEKAIEKQNLCFFEFPKKYEALGGKNPIDLKTLCKTTILEVTLDPHDIKGGEYLSSNGGFFTGVLISKPTSEVGEIQCECKNGKLHGVYIQYCTGEDAGQIAHIKHYNNGVQDGPDTFLYKLAESKNYDSFDLLDDDGALRDFFEKSEYKHRIMRQRHYNNGVVDGKIIDCNGTGGVNWEGNVKDGKQDGVWKIYVRTEVGQGNLFTLQVMEADEVVSGKYYDFDNNEITKEEQQKLI